MSVPGSSWGRDNHSFADGVYDPQNDELLNAFRDNMEELRILAGEFFRIVSSVWCRLNTSYALDYINDTPTITPAKVHADILQWLETDLGKESGGVRGIFRRVDEGLHSNLSEDKVIDRACQGCVDDLIS